MRHLNVFFAPRGGNLNKPIFKSSNARGGGGGGFERSVYLYGQEYRISPTTFLLRRFCISVFAFSFRHCEFDLRYFGFSFHLSAFPLLSSQAPGILVFAFSIYLFSGRFNIRHFEFRFQLSLFRIRFQHLAFGILDLDFQLSAFRVVFRRFQLLGIRV